jgi:hypothetical protein
MNKWPSISNTKMCQLLRIIKTEISNYEMYKLLCISNAEMYWLLSISEIEMY